MYHGRFIVTTEMYSGTKNTETETDTYADGGEVAAHVEGVSRKYRNVPSGMEGYGEGICVLEGDHECSDKNPKCIAAEYEGARRWVERRCAWMTHGDSVDFYITREQKWASVVVEFRDDDPAEERA